jgi:hypothetical protein
MTTMIRNIGPLAGFFAAVAWLCWEQLVPPKAPPDFGPNKVTRIDAKLLNPELPPPCERNPLAPVAPVVAQTAPVNAETLAQEAAAGEDQARSAATLPVKLKLRGTYLGGMRKSALIDNRLCFEGDCVPGIAAGQEDACRLTQVERDHVVLRIEDQEFRLEYAP